MASAQPPNPSDIYSQAQQVKHYKSGYLGGHIIQRPSVDGNENPMYHQSSRRRHVVLEVGGLKQDLKDKLHAIVFDEELKARESLCCVCLGEFEMKEELKQLPSCKHIFHSNCICNWLSSSTTCPLCRCSLVVDNAKLVTPPPPPPPPQSSATVLLPAATPEHLEA
ncbi:putative E3 ubiquitin-protein ligase RHA4A [Apium graveolens]|uniref:putative E3 ubiquitin-protein ligase RHA4A n=1 Tax=Apium graveolens TaxID=4045 RepID=UPI003D796FF8